MAKNWYKFINKQQEQDCQVVTAVNAYYYLTGKTIQYASPEYEELKELAGAIAGTAICIDKVYKKLGIKIDEKFMFLSDFLWQYNLRNMKQKIKRTKYPFPIEMTCWHKRTGFHSVLIIDHCKKCDAFRICNFQEATTHEGWIFSEDMYTVESPLYSGSDGINSDKGKRWRYRSFTLTKKT